MGGGYKTLNKPGSGRRKKSYFNRGRQTDKLSLGEVIDLIGSDGLKRDLLIEYLHIIQDKYTYLQARHLRALADLMKISMSEVYEVASFYAHFTILDDKDKAIPDITLRVCESLTCELFGANDLYNDLIGSGINARILKAPCMGRCDKAPVVEVKHHHVLSANKEKVINSINNKSFKPDIPNFITLEQYIIDGGYSLLKKIKDGAIKYEEVSQVFNKAGLRGLGGAGFPAYKKWSFVRSYEGPRLMCINADEGEPGTFKDKYYLEKDPHRFLEGCLVALNMVDAEKCYIYIRDEYPGIIKTIKEEIKKIENEKIIKIGLLEVRRGAGAYICGEESALIESVEGKRGIPRNRPPYVAQVGLFGKPTLVHNVETVYWIRQIYEKGSDWFSSYGRNGRTGLRSFSVSGFIKSPGVKLAPAGISVKELIEEYCDGMEEGHKFIGYLPGGASGGILPSNMDNIPLDFDTLQPYGCFIGSAAVIILSDKFDMKLVGINLMKFFEDESCGQCTPCRNGTSMAVKLMSRENWDLSLLKELADTMTSASICGLGQAASNPLISIMKHFPEYISNGEE